MVRGLYTLNMGINLRVILGFLLFFFNCSFWVEVLYIFAYTFNKFKNKNWEHMFEYILDFFSSSTQGQN